MHCFAVTLTTPCPRAEKCCRISFVSAKNGDFVNGGILSFELVLKLDALLPIWRELWLGRGELNYHDRYSTLPTHYHSLKVKIVMKNSLIVSRNVLAGQYSNTTKLSFLKKCVLLLI